MEIINKKNRKLFLYILIDIILVFALNFYYLHFGQLFLYGLMILIASFLIFATKNLIAGLFDINVKGKFWISGFIFSGIATLLASIFGVPIPIPVVSYNDYERKNTIKGLKKGAVKIHEKWEITFLSSVILLLIAALFIGVYHVLKENAFFIAGVSIAMFVFIDFLPEKRFNGITLAYHNLTMYSITFLFLLIIGILSIIDYSVAILIFIGFIIFITITYVLKLW